MDWDRIEGNWKQFKGKVKEQWGKLTDDEIDEIAGRRDQLEGKIQERYGSPRTRSAATWTDGFRAIDPVLCMGLDYSRSAPCQPTSRISL